MRRMRVVATILACALAAWETAAAQRLTTVMTRDVPVAAPTGIVFNPTAYGLGIAWQASNGAASYQVWVAPDSLSQGQAASPPLLATTFTAAAGSERVLAFYRVLAFAADGRSASSSPIRYAPPALGVVGDRLREPVPDGSLVAPPPTSLQVASYNASYHTLRWESGPFLHFRILRKDAANPSWVVLAEKHSYKGFDDHTFAQLNTTYMVEAFYPDGKVGSAEVFYASPPQPRPPTGFTAVQVSGGAVKLSWTPEPGASMVRLQGPGFPAAGTETGAKSLTVTGLPVGRHTWTIASKYDAGYIAAGMTATVADVRPTSGNYRVVITGIQVMQETADDPGQWDGKRDEVYVSGYFATYPFYWGPPTSTGHSATLVYGDVNGNPGRLLGGTASPQGGIKTGDLLPPGMNEITLQTPRIPLQAFTDRLPLLLWQGELRDSGQTLAVTPAIWESDKNDAGAYDLWSSWWTSPNIAPMIGEIATAERTKPVAFVRFAKTDQNGWPYQPIFDVGPGKDRPIGISGTSDWSGTVTNPNSLNPFGLMLTREKIEAKLGPGINAFVMAWNYRDRETLGSSYYRVFMQVERIP